MSLNIFIQAAYIIDAARMHFMERIKKADRNDLVLLYILTLLGGER